MTPSDKVEAERRYPIKALPYGYPEFRSAAKIAERERAAFLDGIKFAEERATLATSRAPIEPGEGEVLPCPFCGEKPIIFEFKDYGFARLKIHCDHCGCCGSHYHAYEIALARAQWNRRAALPKPAPAPAEVEQIAEAAERMARRMGGTFTVDPDKVRDFPTDVPFVKSAQDRKPSGYQSIMPAAAPADTVPVSREWLGMDSAPKDGRDIFGLAVIPTVDGKVISCVTRWELQQRWQGMGGCRMLMWTEVPAIPAAEIDRLLEGARP